MYFGSGAVKCLDVLDKYLDFLVGNVNFGAVHFLIVYIGFAIYRGLCTTSLFPSPEMWFEIAGGVSGLFLAVLGRCSGHELGLAFVRPVFWLG